MGERWQIGDHLEGPSNCHEHPRYDQELALPASQCVVPGAGQVDALAQLRIPCSLAPGVPPRKLEGGDMKDKPTGGGSSYPERKGHRAAHVYGAPEQ